MGPRLRPVAVESRLGRAKSTIPVNPAHIRGAGNSTRVHKIEPATLPELIQLVAATRPERYRLMILLAAWCALRFGKQTELRRGDIDLTNGVIRVRRGVVRAAGEIVVDTPKTAAGTQDVAIAPQPHAANCDATA
jgi:integrase